jgi:hypothetical protein
VKCAGNPACPFPPLLGGEYCQEHEIDRRMPLTLHEMSGERIRILEEEGDLWRGFSHPPRAERGRGRPKLIEETEESRKRSQRRARANTYCMVRLPEGRLCQNPIPLTETICESCQERLLPTKGKDAAKL